MTTHTVLGAGGRIATELARELHRRDAGDLRLVSRTPAKIHDTDELRPADLLDPAQARAAIAGSDTVHFTVGLPASTALWEERFPPLLRNCLDAGRETGARFVHFDNTYMYPQDPRVQTEHTPFEPVGPKGRIRADMATMVLQEMARGEIPVLLARAPEFYGPAGTQSFTHALVLDRMREGKRPLVPVRDDRPRSLIWIPDAGRALALLSTTDDAYGRTWHLPVDHQRPTYRELIAAASAQFDVSGKYVVLPAGLLHAAGIVSAQVGELRELLPRYAHDNLFDDFAFRTAFPDFAVTRYQEALAQLRAETGR